MENKFIGKTICSLRKKRNMTQADLAGKIGVTDKAVSKWERNVSCPDVTTIPRLAEILNISVEELIGGSNKNINTLDKTEKNQNKKTLLPVIFKSIGMALGVATFVLNMMEKITVKDSVKLLSLSVVCLALTLFNNEK